MTICAPATALGGAIAVVRMSGPSAITIAESIFSRPLANAESHKALYGHISSEGCIIDEVVLTLFRAPHSYTSEDSVEISCHGSQYIVQRIMELLIQHGARQARPGEFTQRAFLNGKMDLAQAEAVADLIASQDAASHRIALTQMRGGFSHKLKELRDSLLQMTSLLELELDFSEEDVEFAERSQLMQLAEQILAEISRLADSFSTGNVLKHGIPVAIIGAPNVGKSTLLNRLLHDDRAIVSSIQGTTRDIIEDVFTLRGTTFRFIDTAGIRHTTDIIEQMGIARSIQAAEKAHIILLMTEPGVDYPDITPHPDQHVIRIVNKSQSFQALTGLGMEWLEEQLLACVPQVSGNEVLITNLRHKEALDLAHADILRSIAAIQAGLSGDLIAEDLRQCLSHLAEILGEITTTDVLANIFSHFCIGK